jgi:hypothetical protein
VCSCLCWQPAATHLCIGLATQLLLQQLHLRSMVCFGSICCRPRVSNDLPHLLLCLLQLLFSC